MGMSPGIGCTLDAVPLCISLWSFHRRYIIQNTGYMSLGDAFQTGGFHGWCRCHYSGCIHPCCFINIPTIITDPLLEGLNTGYMSLGGAFRTGGFHGWRRCHHSGCIHPCCFIDIPTIMVGMLMVGLVGMGMSEE